MISKDNFNAKTTCTKNYAQFTRKQRRKTENAKNDDPQWMESKSFSRKTAQRAERNHSAAKREYCNAQGLIGSALSHLPAQRETFFVLWFFSRGFNKR